jgi:SAM-dependent methyltransferase
VTIARALTALTEGDRERARAIAAVVDTPLGHALAEYLGSDVSGAVYDQPAAFQAFIDGGGNVGLYEAVSAALSRLYDELQPQRLLDIGCGDGRALLPALASGHRPAQITLVEPSAALLEVVVDRLTRTQPQIEIEVHNRPIEQFVASAGAHDIAQSTFAIHAVRPDVRDIVLAALAPKLRTIAIVEFDVPDLAIGERVEFLADTYERGLREYEHDRDLVAQGFLMPVLTGQLLPGALRSTWEQPASAWVEQVARAGFTDVATTPLFDYWSSPAFLLTGSGGADPVD